MLGLDDLICGGSTCFGFDRLCFFQIFSNLLRGFGLPFSTKESILLGIENLESVNSVSNLSQVFMYSTQDINAMACWIVNMIGSGPPDDLSSDDQSSRSLCMNHIKRLFELLRSFFYPSNTGTWSVSRIFRPVDHSHSLADQSLKI